MVNKFLTVLLLTTISFSCFAQNTGNFKAGSYNGHTLLISTANGYIDITPFTPDVIRVTYKAGRNTAIKSYSTIAQPLTVKAKYSTNAGFVTLQTSALKVVVNKSE